MRPQRRQSANDPWRIARPVVDKYDFEFSEDYSSSLWSDMAECLQYIWNIVLSFWGPDASYNLASLSKTVSTSRQIEDCLRYDKDPSTF